MSKRPLLKLLLISSFIISLSAVYLVSNATADSTVNFADTNMVNCQFWVYQANGTFLGAYNSTDNDVYIPTSAIIVLKPAPVDFFKNPMLIPTLILNMLGGMAGVFVITFIFAGIWFVFFKH